MHKPTVFWSCAALLIAGTMEPGGAASARNVDDLNAVSDMITTHRYRQAEAVLDSLQAIRPESTDVRMQRMVLLYTWIDDFGIADSLSNRLLASIDTVIAFARRDLARDHDNYWAEFFKGSAFAYRSLFRSYVEGIGIGNVRSLLSDASNGIDALDRARRLDPDLADPLIGIGKYKHWKSNKFPWPISSSKERREGIRMLEEAVSRGAQADGGAAQTLGWVYISEGRYDDAIALISPYLDRYPDSRFFVEILGRAHLEKGEYALAETYYRRILDGLSPAERASNFVVMKYERYIGRIRLEQGEREEACRIARRLKALDFTGVHPDWYRRKIGVVDRTIERACR